MQNGMHHMVPCLQLRFESNYPTWSSKSFFSFIPLRSFIGVKQQTDIIVNDQIDSHCFMIYIWWVMKNMWTSLIMFDPNIRSCSNFHKQTYNLWELCLKISLSCLLQLKGHRYKKIALCTEMAINASFHFSCYKSMEFLSDRNKSTIICSLGL